MGFLAPIGAAIAPLFATTASTLTTVGTAVAAGSAIYGGITGAQAASYQSKVAKANAEIAQQNAQSSLMAGQEAESAKRMETGRRIGAAIAAQGASGIDVGFGAPVEVQTALANEGNLDALTLRYNAARQALGYQNQEQGYLAESSFAKQQGTQSLVKGALGATTSIIGGARSLSGMRPGYGVGDGGAVLAGKTAEVRF